MDIVCNSGDDVSFTVSASWRSTNTIQVSNSSSSIECKSISAVQNPTNDNDWNLLVNNGRYYGDSS